VFGKNVGCIFLGKLYTYDMTFTKENRMSVENTLKALSNYCINNSGDMQVWTGKSSTYHWNRGKTQADGIVNGVVRKLAGVDANNGKIWVVAGSFKIAPTGEILRFTGIPRKTQIALQNIKSIVINTEVSLEAV
jgi:hypothetical protein